jgi:hypothetical protein
MLNDYGYSNYTVEGTMFSCVIGKHPDGKFDNFYGEEDKLKYADECIFFREGEPAQFTVEGDTLK